MTKRLKVYLSYPITQSRDWIAQRDEVQAVETLLEGLGWSCFVPHKQETGVTDQELYRNDLTNLLSSRGTIAWFNGPLEGRAVELYAAIQDGQQVLILQSPAYEGSRFIDGMLDNLHPSVTIHRLSNVDTMCAAVQEWLGKITTDA